MTLAIEPFQRAAWQALGGSATHVMIYGGARSGKTDVILQWLVLRSLNAPHSTQAILRHHFNHLKASIILGSLPKVCQRISPGRPLYELNRSDWYATFDNGARIVFGGLDDKHRTEKILGQEHSTIYLNECSQITYAARNIAVTRLSQRAGLQLKAVYDQNPPMVGHWTHQLFVEGRDPATKARLHRPEDYACVRMNPVDNPHLPAEILKQLQALPPRERARFWEGKFGTGASQPLWTYESIERARVEVVTSATLTKNITRAVVAVDPSGCRGPEDERSDEVGIVVVGRDENGKLYVLEDASGRMGPNMGPNGELGWGAVASKMFHKWGADCIVGETNFGGAMVQATIQVADPRVPFREVSASRAKHVRAEPVSVLFDQGNAVICGVWPELESQLMQFSSNGYEGDRSPDRADAMIWGAYALGVVRTPGQGLLDYYAEKARAAAAAIPKPTASAATVTMLAPPHITGVVSTLSGRIYCVSDGRVTCAAEDVESLQGIGFRTA